MQATTLSVINLLGKTFLNNKSIMNDYTAYSYWKLKIILRLPGKIQIIKQC